MPTPNSILIAIAINAALLITSCAKPAENTTSVNSTEDTGAVLKPDVTNTIADLTLYIVDNVRPLDMIAHATKQMRSFFKESCNFTIKTSILPVQIQSTLNADPLTSASLRILTEDTIQEKQTTLRLFFIHSTLENDTAFAYLPSADVVESGTAWVTRMVSNDCLPVIMAHEIGHLLLDDATHSTRQGNIMYHGCTSTNFGSGYKLRTFDMDQCKRMQEQLLLRKNV